MKFALLVVLSILSSPLFADTDVRIPDAYIPLIKSTDYIEVSGTNDLGGQENFSIHNAKAISQFVQYLTDDRYTAAPKSLKPDFKSLSSYQIRLSSKGALVLEFNLIADSVLDLPKESSYYMESDRYSENLMSPLLRLR